MADVMYERVRSIQRCVGVCFITGALLLTFSIVAQPVFGDINRTDQILGALAKQDWGAWMQLHAVMMLGFALVTVGFAALAFLLHLKGSSGSASGRLGLEMRYCSVAKLPRSISRQRSLQNGT